MQHQVSGWVATNCVHSSCLVGYDMGVVSWCDMGMAWVGFPGVMGGVSWYDVVTTWVWFPGVMVMTRVGFLGMM